MVTFFSTTASIGLSLLSRFTRAMAFTTQTLVSSHCPKIV
jgi:hypothetical protein